jgi:hypothetical protein
MKKKNKVAYLKSTIKPINALNIAKSSNQLIEELVKTDQFKTSSEGTPRVKNFKPDEKTIRTILKSSKKKFLQKSTIIVARFDWLKRHKMLFPEKVDLVNLIITIKNGKLYRIFYSNVMTHVIKKQNYYIQILN